MGAKESRHRHAIDPDQARLCNVSNRHRIQLRPRDPSAGHHLRRRKESRHAASRDDEQGTGHDPEAGNGYAEEYEISRVLCAARILNIFEGAAEIQAQVIARGLLERRN